MVLISMTLWVPNSYIDRSFTFTSCARKDHYISFNDADIPLFACSLLGPEDTVNRWISRLSKAVMIDMAIIALVEEFRGFLTAQLKITGEVAVSGFFALEPDEAVHLKLRWPT